MIRIIPRLLACFAACVAALILVSGCQVSPKHHMASGKFAEWKTVEGKHFSPMNGIVTAIDPTASTVTIDHGKESKVYPVSPTTRIIHEGTDIPLAQLPVPQTVKYSLSVDGKKLLSVWYGNRLYTYRRPGSAANRTPAPL
jgi:hypothetical protein